MVYFTGIQPSIQPSQKTLVFWQAKEELAGNLCVTPALPQSRKPSTLDYAIPQPFWDAFFDS